MKLKGGILYYTLFVIILSSSIIGLILQSSFYDYSVLVNTIKQDDLERNVESAINLYLEGENVFKGHDSISLNLFDDDQEKVLLTKRRWGNYFIINSASKWKNRSSEKFALIGSDLNYQEPIALFMPDEGRILSLSGNTILKGTCYLPKKTARIASIEGQQFIYKDLVLGNLEKSPPRLPNINEKLLSHAYFYLNAQEIQNDSIINLNSLGSNQIVNSFNNKTIFLFNNTVTNLKDFRFSGNIIVWSNEPVEIERSTSLHDIILFAPIITIKSGFEGEFQAYATQSIKVEGNCKIKFPSQLCVIQSETGKYNPSDSLIVGLGKGSLVEGGILINSFGLTSFIKIDKGAKVSGQVYCPGFVELNGEVIGSLYCKTFYLKTARGRYYNHLLNTRIDYSSLSEYFSGIDLLKDIPQKLVIKWLD